VMDLNVLYPTAVTVVNTSMFLYSIYFTVIVLNCCFLPCYSGVKCSVQTCLCLVSSLKES
jgi:hypothetical protein